MFDLTVSYPALGVARSRPPKDKDHPLIEGARYALSLRHNPYPEHTGRVVAVRRTTSAVTFSDVDYNTFVGSAVNTPVTRGDVVMGLGLPGTPAPWIVGRVVRMLNERDVRVEYLWGPDDFTGVGEYHLDTWVRMLAAPPAEFLPAHGDDPDVTRLKFAAREKWLRQRSALQQLRYESFIRGWDHDLNGVLAEVRLTEDPLPEWDVTVAVDATVSAPNLDLSARGVETAANTVTTRLTVHMRRPGVTGISAQESVTEEDVANELVTRGLGPATVRNLTHVAVRPS